MLPQIGVAYQLFIKLNYMIEIRKILKNVCRLKSYLLVLALLFFAVSNTFAKESSILTEIIERGVDKIKLKISTEKEGRDAIIVLRKENIEAVYPDFSQDYIALSNMAELTENNTTGEGNAVIYQGALSSEQLIVSNLEHNTDYAIDLYYSDEKDAVELDKSILFSTLQNEPTKQTNGIMVSVPVGGVVGVRVKEAGDGEKRYLLVGENSDPTDPVDGVFYQTSSDIKKTARIDEHTFIFDTPRDNKFIIENLKSSTNYILKVIEANGEMESINYLTEDGNNKDEFKTPPSPPINLQVVRDSRNRLKAIWEIPEGAEKFQIDLATDPDFKNILSMYSGMQISKIDEYTFIGLNKDKYYYLRMRTIDDSGYSSYTETKKVKINSL